MRISEIDKNYTKKEAIADDAYIVVDSESKGTGKMKVSELSNGVGSSGGTESESFVINVTMDSDGSLTSDKTYEEISATFNGGQTDIKCLLKGCVFHLMMVADHQTPWTFQNVSVGSISSSDYSVIDARLTISSTNEIDFSTIMKKLVLES